MEKRVINICDVCEEIFAGGDAPKDRFSETKTDDFSVPIYSNGEANSGLYGYTNFSRVNVPSITVSARGTIGYTTIRHEPFVPIVRLITLVPKTDVIDINYLYYATQNYKFVNNGTSIPQLTVPMLKRYSFPLPSMEQQKKIADEFDKVLALELGADTAGSFDGVHTELVDTRATKPDAVMWGHNYGIVVNQDCERFYDEGKRHLFATFEMIALDLWRYHNGKGYFITDSTIMNRFRPGWVYESTDQEPVEANTISELAKKLGVDPVKLNKTVTEFNSACNDKEFNLMALDGKATTGLSVNKTNWANPLDKPPYYAYPITTQLTFTYGGVKVNTDSQVLGTNGAPIPGLWAAGELTGLYYNGTSPFKVLFAHLVSIY